MDGWKIKGFKVLIKKPGKLFRLKKNCYTDACKFIIKTKCLWTTYEPFIKNKNKSTRFQFSYVYSSTVYNIWKNQRKKCSK